MDGNPGMALVSPKDPGEARPDVKAEKVEERSGATKDALSRSAYTAVLVTPGSPHVHLDYICNGNEQKRMSNDSSRKREREISGRLIGVEAETLRA
jgi:hypothetical protein